MRRFDSELVSSSFGRTGRSQNQPAEPKSFLEQSGHEFMDANSSTIFPLESEKTHRAPEEASISILGRTRQQRAELRAWRCGAAS